MPSFFFSGMMLASRSLASSAVSTGVLPCLTTCLGPRTELAGLKSMTPPLVSQSKQHADGGEVLLDGRCRPGFGQLLDVGGDVHRLDVA